MSLESAGPAESMTASAKEQSWKRVARGVDASKDERGETVYRVAIKSRGLIATTKSLIKARTMADAEAIISSGK